MSLLRNIKYLLINTTDFFTRYFLKKSEIKKFKDKRRIAIYNNVILKESQKKEIDDIYTINYGQKIPYTWHRHFTAFTGNFDPYYFPELLFIPEFEKFMNLDEEYVYSFSDKNVLPFIAKSIDVKMPKTYISCINGILRNSNYEIINKIKAIEILKNKKNFFIKPTIDSCSGNGCLKIELNNSIDKLSGESIDEIINSLGENYIVQETIICHDSISRIYDKSVNTFRIMTYIWKNKIYHVPVIMRIGQGGKYLDNAHAGGMFIALDDDGKMHKTAFTEFKKEYEKHPDTNFKFEDYKIELLPNVINTAIKMHSAIPQLGCINWDFTLDLNGVPVLIETNLNGGSIWLFEMAHGKGPFGSQTEEILRWMNIMKHTKKTDRYKYRYGNGIH